MFYYIVYFKSTKRNIYVLNSYYACALRLTVTIKIALCGALAGKTAKQYKVLSAIL
jgi:hypothetical protein